MTPVAFSRAPYAYIVLSIFPASLNL